MLNLDPYHVLERSSLDVLKLRKHSKNEWKGFGKGVPLQQLKQG